MAPVCSQFWKAIELTNKSLLPEGLYVSHLFTDKQVALTPDWLNEIVEIEVGELRYLWMFRPSAVDLILTKMMRNNPQDIGDIRFILAQGKVEPAELEKAFASARPLEIAELQEIFVKMQPLVREMAAQSRAIGNVSQNLGSQFGS
jgi:hypothetical protein